MAILLAICAGVAALALSSSDRTVNSEKARLVFHGAIPFERFAEIVAIPGLKVVGYELQVTDAAGGRSWSSERPGADGRLADSRQLGRLQSSAGRGQSAPVKVDGVIHADVVVFREAVAAIERVPEVASISVERPSQWQRAAHWLVELLFND